MDNNLILNSLGIAKDGINEYLENAVSLNKIDNQLFNIAKRNTYSNLEKWLTDSNIDLLSPNLKKGVINSIEAREWEQIVNAYRQYLSFGTGGIRGMMAYDYNSIKIMKEDPLGIDVPILKGPNTINNIVLLLTSTGVAQFGKEKGFKKIVIGYDSRVRGFDFASLVAQLFLAYNYTVYLFDAPCPYPEVTFAIPFQSIKADVGILISASHNDYRYNGYKLSCGNGSQFGAKERDIIYNKFVKVLFDNKILSDSTSQIKLKSLKDADRDQLWFLGGNEKVPGFDYLGFENNIINIHDSHKDHVASFLVSRQDTKKQAISSLPLQIGFCAYHGAGRIAVPRLLKDSGFQSPLIVTKNSLNDLNGLFPSFPSDSGRERQPDPGDPRAAKVAVDSFKEDHPNKFESLDILIGTDPDADRCGVVIKVPQRQRFIYDFQDWCLIPSDDLWALLVWYRLTEGQDNVKVNKIPDVNKKFIVLSHTTSDSIVKLAQKFNIGVVKTWVGFAMLASATQDLWEGNHDVYQKYLRINEGIDPNDPKLSHPIVFQSYGLENSTRSINIAAMEQSNGFSILGGPPSNNSSLGENGHVRDKDGTFAAILTAELAAFAKDHGTSLFDLIDEKIYLDPEIGLFINGYEPDPLDGEYPGIIGDKIKKNILHLAYGLFHEAQTGNLSIAGIPVKSANIYRTGKYDHVYPPTLEFQFPDEGIRLYFDNEKLNYVTIRPSGTGNSLRFHSQLHSLINKEKLSLDDPISKEFLLKKLISKKEELRIKTDEIFSDLRLKLKAPKKRIYPSLENNNE